MPRYPIIPLALTASLIALSGCSNKEPIEQPTFDGMPFEVEHFTPDLREHHTSWGHTGRGGAALRKPSYQPVLGSPDTLETRYGKLHPKLQPQQITATVSVPPALAAGACHDETPSTMDFDLIPSGEQNTHGQASSTSIYALANSTGSVNDYIRVRNKLCQGAERLTYEEWEILVTGTPRDVPLRLQPSHLKIGN